MKQTKSFLLATKPPIAFVAHPFERGRWLKTERCVLFVQCPWCNQPPGMPCMAKHGYTATVHYVRRDKFKEKKAEFKMVSVPTFVLEPGIMVALQAVIDD